MQVTVTVCDVCKNPALPTQHYKVESAGVRGSGDLCEEHAEPLEQLLTRQGSARAAAHPGRRRSTMKLTPVGEIPKAPGALQG